MNCPRIWARRRQRRCQARAERCAPGVAGVRLPAARSAQRGARPKMTDRREQKKRPLSVGSLGAHTGRRLETAANSAPKQRLLDVPRPPAARFAHGGGNAVGLWGNLRAASP